MKDYPEGTKVVLKKNYSFMHWTNPEAWKAAQDRGDIGTAHGGGYYSFPHWANSTKFFAASADFTDPYRKKPIVVIKI